MTCAVVAFGPGLLQLHRNASMRAFRIGRHSVLQVKQGDVLSRLLFLVSAEFSRVGIRF